MRTLTRSLSYGCLRGWGTLAIMLVGLSCTDDRSPNPLDPEAISLTSGSPPPADLVPVTLGDGSLSLWPYTGVDFSGTPQDPINLIFAGKADTRALRAALMALSGDRTAFGFPSAYPFNCTWSDAIGDLQTGYNGAVGWTGSAVQLGCGTFGPLRFHARLFDAGLVTVANAHFEVLIPGTTEHQVLSWELAEQLVTADLVRSGLLGAVPGATGPINSSPSFRDIPSQIYNGLPVDLKLAIGGPAGSVSTPVPIASDGRATLLQLSGETKVLPGITDQTLVIEWGQVIPRPFCVEGPAEFVLVEGPVSLSKSVELTGAGELRSEFLASGQLRLTPVDPSTGLPSGPQYGAEVGDHQVTSSGAAGASVDGLVRQMELPQNVAGRGRKVVRLKVGPGGVTEFNQEINCKRSG